MFKKSSPEKSRTHLIKSVYTLLLNRYNATGLPALAVPGLAIISGHPLPKYLSSDNDPLFLYHRWKANLRIIDIEEIKSEPQNPNSQGGVEGDIGIYRKPSKKTN